MNPNRNAHRKSRILTELCRLPTAFKHSMAFRLMSSPCVVSKVILTLQLRLWSARRLNDTPASSVEALRMCSQPARHSFTVTGTMQSSSQEVSIDLATIPAPWKLKFREIKNFPKFMKLVKLSYVVYVFLFLRKCRKKIGNIRLLISNVTSSMKHSLTITHTNLVMSETSLP